MSRPVRGVSSAAVVPIVIVLLLVCAACAVAPPAPGPSDPPTVPLAVRDSGPRGAPPVVLLHGFPETGAAWDDVAADLARDHRVLAPDLRGAGRSPFAPPGTDAYGARALASDLAALVDRLGLPPAVVVGHDLGAMTAVAWARARPDQVARLVLSGGGVPGFGLLEQGPPHVRELAAAPPGAAAAALAGREQAFLEAFVRAGAGPAAGSAATRRLVDDAVRAYTPPGRLDAAFGRYRALPRDGRDNTDPALPPVLGVPVLVLASGLPDLTDATLSTLAPGRRVVVVPGAGHFLPTERPREAAAAIRDAAG